MAHCWGEIKKRLNYYQAIHHRTASFKNFGGLKLKNPNQASAGAAFGPPTPKANNAKSINTPTK